MGAVVPVTGGTLWVGIPAFTWTAAGVTIAASGNVIGWEWFGSSISLRGDKTANYFVDSEDALRGWFHQWSIVDGVAIPILIGHLGNLKFPGNYAVKP